MYLNFLALDKVCIGFCSATEQYESNAFDVPGPEYVSQDFHHKFNLSSVNIYSVPLWGNLSQLVSPLIAALALLSSITIYNKKRKTGSLRNSLLAGYHTWYGNPFWSILKITLVVAAIVLVGQVAAIISPIYYGPTNSCKDDQSLVPGLDWSGYKWTVSPDGYNYPGPNYWSSNNVWVDSNGDLHLRISKNDNKWYCAEITTHERLPFGKYQFWVIGRLDHLDKNVVFGLFNYPSSDVGPDETNEIGIEMSRWSNENSPMGSYVVWPNVLNGPKYVELFPVTLTGGTTTHRFIWRSNDVYFQSLNGFRDWNDTAPEIHSGNTSYTNYVAQKAMPIHINLWLNKGQPPYNDQPVEILIRKFTYSP